MDDDRAMDALADVLKTIRLRANTYFCEDFISPWGMDISNTDSGSFHVIVKGSCWLKTGNEESPICLEEGDIVAFPTGGAHWLSDTPFSTRLPAAGVVEDILNGSNPFRPPNNSPQQSINTLLCGSFGYDSLINHPFLKDLPCFIHIKASATAEMDWLRFVVSALASESRYPSPGSTVMVDRLTEILFIQLMRIHTNKAPQSMRYMTALADPKIGAALNLIHSETHSNWNVERLAASVAVSRTRFTEKFTQLVGMPPKTYLLNWSMHKAKMQLQSSTAPMIDIAESAGYSSEAAFSKAFKQFFDSTPGRVRHSLS